jgi:hypothetical protein
MPAMESETRLLIELPFVPLLRLRQAQELRRRKWMRMFASTLLLPTLFDKEYGIDGIYKINKIAVWRSAVNLVNHVNRV